MCIPSLIYGLYETERARERETLLEHESKSLAVSGTLASYPGSRGRGKESLVSVACACA